MEGGSPDPQIGTRRREPRRSRRFFAVIAWAVVIFLSSMTVILWEPFVEAVGSRFGPQGTARFEAFWEQWWWVFVKGWHVLEFFILFLLAHRFLQTRVPFRESVAWSALLTLLYAVGDEFHQTFVALRGGRIEDVVIDLVGVVAAVLLMLAKRRASTRPSSGPRPCNTDSSDGSSRPGS